MLVAGMLLLTIGLGLLFTNKPRIKAFERAYNDSPSFFLKQKLFELKKHSNIVNNCFYYYPPVNYGFVFSYFIFKGGN